MALLIFGANTKQFTSVIKMDPIVLADGKITITGGKGGRGGNAKDSIMGMANGGNGGSGGIGLVAARYLDFCTDNLIRGGSGGSGGDPSDAFFGLGTSSGERGRSGATGLSKKIADSWDK